MIHLFMVFNFYEQPVISTQKPKIKKIKNKKLKTELSNERLMAQPLSY